MYPENVAKQDASSSTEQSIGSGHCVCNQIKSKTSPKMNAEPSSLPVKLPSPHLTGKVKKFCAISRNSVSSSEAERDPLQTISPKPKKSQQRQVRNLSKKLFQSYQTCFRKMIENETLSLV